MVDRQVDYISYVLQDALSIAIMAIRLTSLVKKQAILYSRRRRFTLFSVLALFNHSKTPTTPRPNKDIQ